MGPPNKGHFAETPKFFCVWFVVFALRTDLSVVGTLGYSGTAAGYLKQRQDVENSSKHL